MLAVPADTPVTTPLVPTVACALLLLHVPPGVISDNVTVPPTVTTSDPSIGAGPRETVTIVVA